MRQIPLSNGEIALVSDEDYGYLSKFSWSRNSSGHVHRSIYLGNYKSVMITMHRELANRLGYGDSPEVDHKDRNQLNNQRENLRPATKSQNQANAGLRKDSTSGYKGVTYKAGKRRWEARIQVGKIRLALGCYNTAEEAAHAYDRAARRHFGEFARTNF